ncbi:hypothetical protein OEZ85_014050 [Tetradesmus obliquus]|uniref:Uncharacterized protein n=1 Tax=Tetradesmus obliquus TaxID=3088 RepID=A0ABY8U9M9_TETOB|nr:hypothetical protein OEZ85_014050 [Tetradesmus obliquus]
MLSALRAGVSACAARIRCRGSTTCFIQQKAASAPGQSWPHSYTASTAAASNCPTGFPRSSSRQTWSLNHQLRAASSGAASASLYQLPAFTFEECAQEVLLCAAPSATAEQRSAAIARLAAQRELMGESWRMLVECGVWARSPSCRTGRDACACSAVLQPWRAFQSTRV